MTLSVTAGPPAHSRHSPDSRSLRSRASFSRARVRARSSDTGRLAIHRCRHAPSRAMAQVNSRGGTVTDAMETAGGADPVDCQSRTAIAHRDPTAYMLQGWFPGSGATRNRISDRFGTFPNPVEDSVATAEFSTPLPLRGQHRSLTGFPNYPVRDGGPAPSTAQSYVSYFCVGTIDHRPSWKYLRASGAGSSDFPHEPISFVP